MVDFEFLSVLGNKVINAINSNNIVECHHMTHTRLNDLYRFNIHRNRFLGSYKSEVTGNWKYLFNTTG